MDCSPPGSSVHGILQARILEWVAISFSRGSSQPGDWTQISCIAGRCFNLWATREAHQQIKDAANSSDMSQSESLGFTRKWEVKDEWSQGVKEESEEGGKFQKTMRKGINDKGGVNWGNGWASQISCKRGAKCWPPLLIKAVTSLRRVKFYLILDWPHLVSTLTPEPGKTWVTYHSSVTQISPILPSSTELNPSTVGSNSRSMLDV